MEVAKVLVPAVIYRIRLTGKTRANLKKCKFVAERFLILAVS